MFRLVTPSVNVLTGPDRRRWNIVTNALSPEYVADFSVEEDAITGGFVWKLQWPTTATAYDVIEMHKKMLRPLRFHKIKVEGRRASSPNRPVIYKLPPGPRHALSNDEILIVRGEFGEVSIVWEREYGVASVSHTRSQESRISTLAPLRISASDFEEMTSRDLELLLNFFSTTRPNLYKLGGSAVNNMRELLPEMMRLSIDTVGFETARRGSDAHVLQMRGPID